MLNIKKISIPCLCYVALFATLIYSDANGSELRQIQSLDSDWRFCAGEIEGAEKPEYDDSSWLPVTVPHDFSIEGLAKSETKEDEAPVFYVAKGEWKFRKGDSLHWKDPNLDDRSWEVVKLPSTWEAHSNYTQDNVYGWYRRELTIPVDLIGEDIYINLGKIDDVDETYFNGVKIGGMGSYPPNYVTAWDLIRQYKVPREIIHYGGKNSIAVRVFDGVGAGGIYHDGERVVEG
ncbi:MAG: hypothetical protein ABIL14_05955, partial [candidate division WOR-3 bacterium]